MGPMVVARKTPQYLIALALNGAMRNPLDKLG